VIDVLFFCDADAYVGFGHAARCLHLARLLKTRKASLQIAFQGHFSNGALHRMMTAAPDIRILSPTDIDATTVGVIDRMTDPADPDVWDPVLTDQVRARCSRLICIASGITVPRLPEGAICIGYQPGGPPANPPSVLWGFEYAPVAGTHVTGRKIERERGTALVAFGGSRDDVALRLTGAAFSRLPGIRRVEVLKSPVFAGDLPRLACRPDQEVVWHENVESVVPLLSRASVVVTSYGNLAYEALVVGAAVCLLGQKPFQVRLAQRLEGLGVAVAAGLVSETDEMALADRIALTLEHAEVLKKRAVEILDGRGLDRIADVILNHVARS